MPPGDPVGACCVGKGARASAVGAGASVMVAAAVAGACAIVVANAAGVVALGAKKTGRSAGSGCATKLARVGIRKAAAFRLTGGAVAVAAGLRLRSEPPRSAGHGWLAPGRARAASLAGAPAMPLSTVLWGGLVSDASASAPPGGVSSGWY